MTPRAGSAPYQVQASWRVAVLRRRRGPRRARRLVERPVGGKAAIAFGNAGLRYFDAAGAVLPHTAGTWAVPVGRGARRRHRGDGGLERAGLGPRARVSATFSATCDPNLPDPPARPRRRPDDPPQPTDIRNDRRTPP